MSSDGGWPAGASGEDGYGADDFGVDPDYQYVTGQDGYDWHSRSGQQPSQPDPRNGNGNGWTGIGNGDPYAQAEQPPGGQAGSSYHDAGYGATPGDAGYQAGPGYGSAGYDTASNDRAGYDRPGYGGRGYSAGNGGSTYGQAGHQNPGYQEPSYQEPTYQEPTYQQPTYQQPSYEEPSYQHSGYQDPRYADPAYLQAARQASGYGSGRELTSGYESPSGSSQPGYNAGSYETGSYEAGSYDAGSREQPSYGQPSYEQPSYQQPTYEQPSYEQAPYDRGSYEQAQYEHAPYTSPSGTSSYGTGDHGTGTYDTGAHDAGTYDTGTYENGSHATGSYDPGSYDPGSYDPGSYDPGSYDPGSYDRNDAWHGREDTGGWVDNGSFERADDSGVFERGDAGGFDESDSLAFARPETGPPSRSSSSGSSRPGSARGYDQWPDVADEDDWHQEADDDWPAEGESGLLSRRFGQGGGDGGDGGDDGRSGRRRRRDKRPKRGRSRVAVLASVLAVVVVLIAAGVFGYQKYQSWHNSRYGDYSGSGTGRVEFVVSPGSALSTLGPALVKAGVIENLRPFDSAAAAAPNGNSLQPGEYLLHHHMSAADAVQYLLSSKHRISDQVTIIEGTRAVAIAQQLSQHTKIPVSKFTYLIDHPSQLGLPSWASGAKTAEGFLFPDTYDLLPGESALQILRSMVAEFKQQVNGINLVSAAKRVNTDAWHILIVASMVQQEAGRPSDFGKIARVAWNRLQQGIHLDFDSTVFYAMGKYGLYATAQEEKYNSPYNTYEHAGLPPGPIGNPGIAAIKATLYPPHGSWLYFITDTNKKPYYTYFTSSYAKFLEYQSEFGN